MKIVKIISNNDRTGAKMVKHLPRKQEIGVEVQAVAILTLSLLIDSWSYQGSYYIPGDHTSHNWLIWLSLYHTYQEFLLYEEYNDFFPYFDVGCLWFFYRGHSWSANRCLHDLVLLKKNVGVCLRRQRKKNGKLLDKCIFLHFAEVVVKGERKKFVFVDFGLVGAMNSSHLKKRFYPPKKILAWGDKNIPILK